MGKLHDTKESKNSFLRPDKIVGNESIASMCYISISVVGVSIYIIDYMVLEDVLL